MDMRASADGSGQVDVDKAGQSAILVVQQLAKTIATDQQPDRRDGTSLIANQARWCLMCPDSQSDRQPETHPGTHPKDAYISPATTSKAPSPLLYSHESASCLPASQPACQLDCKRQQVAATTRGRREREMHDPGRCRSSKPGMFPVGRYYLARVPISNNKRKPCLQPSLLH